MYSVMTKPSDRFCCRGCHQHSRTLAGTLSSRPLVQAYAVSFLMRMHLTGISPQEKFTTALLVGGLLLTGWGSILFFIEICLAMK